MGDTLRVPNTQRGGNTQIPPVEDTISRPSSPASNQPRKYDQYPESTAIINTAATMKPKDTMARPEAAYYQNFPAHGLQSQQSRQNSSSFLFNTPRQDSFLLGNSYPIGPPPTAPNPATMQRSGYPGYYMTGRDSISFPGPQNDASGRLRGDSISLPHPLQPQKYPDPDPLNFPVSQGAPTGQPQHNPSRSTSIFSSLIQLPDSSQNSLSGPSSKDTGKPDSRQKQPGSSSRGYSQDFDPAGKDSFGNIFGWSQGSKVSPSQSKRNTKEYENQNAFWDQMGNGMGGSITGINNDSLNAFMSSLHNNGSIDFSNMSNEQRRDSIMKFISDQGLRPENSQMMGTSLREDIFDDQRKISASTKDRKSSHSDMNHVSPTSSMSSKASKIKDEAHSPRTSPGRHPSQTIDNTGGMQMRGVQPQFNQQQRQPSAFYQPPPHEAFGFPYQEIQHYQGPQMRTSFSQFQPPLEAPPQQQYASNRGRDNYHHMFKGSPFIAPEAVEQPNYYPKTNNRSAGQNEDGKPLVQAQQYARAEDGRPLLGATKVDQLMLVIQAREKGNTTAIKQSQDGSILATPNTDHDKNAVLPSTVDLVGGIDKPQKDDHNDDGMPHKKRKRRGKSQECPYCFKQFHQTTHLDVHVRSHIGLKPFECTFCGKRFTQGGNLRTHMRLHTGEKPFVCDVCNRNFSRKGNLAAHMLTHNKEKPFECKLDNCDKSFTQLGNLKSHQNKFHLPTLTKLTQTFASITGDALAQLPAEEKDLLEYFAKLYKNANKGIRGRGKGKRVTKLVGDGASPPSPIKHTSEQLPLTMTRPLEENEQGEMNANVQTAYTPGAQKYQ